jgi:hypothetical protein
MTKLELSFGAGKEHIYSLQDLENNEIYINTDYAYPIDQTLTLPLKQALKYPQSPAV